MYPKIRSELTLPTTRIRNLVLSYSSSCATKRHKIYLSHGLRVSAEDEANSSAMIGLFRWRRVFVLERGERLVLESSGGANILKGQKERASRRVCH
jgi:hypothetical protein